MNKPFEELSVELCQVPANELPDELSRELPDELSAQLEEVRDRYKEGAHPRLRGTQFIGSSSTEECTARNRRTELRVTGHR